ncbi:MAG TPA: hypothetical protein VFH59_09925 [Frateuria sp.]|uniref:STY1053 family phage-associated protein n=1 Tax=Frateuria sp. TaxID=2211372 RepID=UPI002D7F2845|nr:hypothetical protein [Frateuria sp.]HET6805745.1 hypothetical protein [Frateuria sp.]
MKRIHVKVRFHLTDQKGERRTFEPGVHPVADDVAEHWYVKAHCLTEDELKAKAEEEAKAEAEEKARQAEAEAKAKAEEKAIKEAEAKAKADKKG